MNKNNLCGVCANTLHANDPGGICPSCLLAHAIPNGANNPTLDAQGAMYPPVEELVGRFANLEIQHLIGHGGMGAVYLARQTNLDRMVALKVLSPRLGNDPAFTERFTREARTLARLSHPNIVTVYDYGQTGSLNYLLMEYVDGINLRDAIRGGKLTPDESLAIVPQICDALQYAHNEGVVHRDIKPENILLNNSGRVKIADFGLAKLLQPNQEEFTLTGTQQVLGTRNYMAPEQIEKPDFVDHRADIYSLGVVFYELLTGELPIGRFAVPSEKAAVTNRLDDVVMRTLEKEPSRRYQQASEVRTAVEAIDRREASPGPEALSPGAQSAAKQALMSLPFSINQMYHGLAAAHGIAHLYADRLELEYEVVDDVVGAVKSSMRNVTVALDSLSKVRFVKGYFSDRIEFQSERLEGAKDVPNSLQGRFSLNTKRADIDQATQFSGLIDQIRTGATATVAKTGFPQQRQTAPAFRQPVPPRKTSVFGLGDKPSLTREEVIDSLKVPRLGFLAFGLIHLLLAAKGFIRDATWHISEPFSTSLAPDVEISLYLPQLDWFNFNHVIMLVVGILLLSISSRLRRPRNYTYVFCALIVVMMSPVHVAYIVTFFLSIWALVVLSDSRCKEVFLAEDAHYRNRQHHFIRTIMAVGIVMAVLTGAAGILALMLWSGEGRVSPTPRPQVVKEALNADPTQPSSTEPDSTEQQDDTAGDSAIGEASESETDSSRSESENKSNDSSENDGAGEDL